VLKDEALGWRSVETLYGTHLPGNRLIFIPRNQEMKDIGWKAVRM
jgi:hypothetical protein